MKVEIKQRIETIKRGEIPPGYKKARISIIPSDDWQEDILGNLGDFYKGKGLPGTEMKERGIPCIGYGDIYTKYNFHFSKAQNFVDEEVAKESQPINRGTLLFTGSGETAEEIGKCVCYDGDDTIYAGGDIVLFNTKKVNPLFIAYQQNIEPCIREKAQLGQGHSVVHIYEDSLKKLSVVYPKDNLVQQKIIKILMKWNETVNIQEKLIEKLEIRKKALMQKLLAPKDGWKAVKVGSVVEEVSLKNKINCKNVMSISNKFGFIKQEEQFTKQVASEDVKNYKIVSKGDIAYNPSRINVGSIAIYQNEEIGIVSPMYVVFKCTKITPQMILLLLSTSRGKYDIETFLSGSVRDSLNFSDLSEIEVRLPSEVEQKSIVKIFRSVDETILLHTQKLTKLKEQQKVMMQLLLTGIVRVNKVGY